MKIWESMKELSNNPLKTFEHKDGPRTHILKTDFSPDNPDSVCYIVHYCHDENGNDVTDEPFGDFFGNIELFDNWQEVKQPVTWQEAFKAWAMGGKTICCKKPNSLPLVYENKTRLDDQFGSGVCPGEILSGTWYIED